MPDSATPKPGNTTAPSNGVPWQLLFWAAISLSACYVIFAALIYLRADDATMSDAVWGRNLVILHGIEAIAFTAIGWLFGREVHRGEALVAKEQAAEAKTTADQARATSAVAEQGRLGAMEHAAEVERTGWQLAEAIRARATLVSTRGGALDSGGPESSPADLEIPDTGPGALGTGAMLSDLKDMADRLFPSA